MSIVNIVCVCVSLCQLRYYWFFVRGIYRWRVKFPHKGSVKRQAFPCHFVIMKTWSYMGLSTVFQSAIKCLTCVSFGMVSYYTKYSLCDIIEVWQRQTWSARLVALRLLVDNLSHIQYALFFTQTLKNPLKWHINRIWPDKRYFLSALDLPAVLQCRLEHRTLISQKATMPRPLGRDIGCLLWIVCVCVCVKPCQLRLVGSLWGKYAGDWWIFLTKGQ